MRPLPPFPPLCRHAGWGGRGSFGSAGTYGISALPPSPPSSPCQVRAKYNSTLVDVFREAFCTLPLGFVLAHSVLVVHGGLFSRDGVTLDEMRAVDRFK